MTGQARYETLLLLSLPEPQKYVNMMAVWAFLEILGHYLTHVWGPGRHYKTRLQVTTWLCKSVLAVRLVTKGVSVVSTCGLMFIARGGRGLKVS